MCSTRPRLTRSGSQSMEPATLRVLSHMIALPRLEHISAKAIIVCHSEPGAQASCLPYSHWEEVACLCCARSTTFIRRLVLLHSITQGTPRGAAAQQRHWCASRLWCG